jgi:hypothetical protein
MGKKKKKINWWESKHELIMRLDAIGEQLRCYPKKIVGDEWVMTRLNIIGKAIVCLSHGLRYLENSVGLEKPEEEDFIYYNMAMKYFKD